jgi:cell wall-associated NlpC family hydrolase
VALGAVASGCGADAAEEEKPAVARAAPAAQVELPPLPDKVKPKVVEPEAGVISGEEDPLADPATGVAVDEDTPKPTGPASNSTATRLKPTGTGGSITKATALENGVALPPLEAPPEVLKIIESGNQIAKTPYKWGGGHGRFVDDGYDCSGSVSYALYSAGLISGPATSGQLRGWGKPGKGKWVTIWTHDGHVFMEVAGIRFDTSGTRKTGSRWQNDMRGTAGFEARHPPGL